MRNIIILIAMLLICGLTGCSYINNADKPHLELIPGPTSRLNISDFDWSYGVVGFNQFNGDFDKLDEKVYNLLVGKYGFCEVYIQQKSKDRYGNDVSNNYYVGRILLNDLIKYKDWHYWQKDEGIRKMIYSRMNSSNDSAKATDSVKIIQPVVQPNYKPTSPKEAVYGFSEYMLYPLAADRANLDTNIYIVDGVIAAANFDSGAMQIQTSESGLIDVQFYPLDASSDVQYKLRLAISPGNTIKSICARAGASTMDLVSCEITSTNSTIHRDTTRK